MKPEKFKITIESYSKETSTTIPNSDVTIDEVVELFEGVLLAHGWHQETIDKGLNKNERINGSTKE